MFHKFKNKFGCYPRSSSTNNCNGYVPFLLLVFRFLFFSACVFGFLGNSEKLGFERLMLVFVLKIVMGVLFWGLSVMVVISFWFRGFIS